MNEKTMKNGSLDDSLTSIQWLCELESSTVLDSKSGRQKSTVTSSPMDCPKENKNPYPKPQYSYANLIGLAINSSRDKRMTLQDIYAWIESNFPFYQHAKKGWKNSIRHNLSLHKFFIKEQRTDVLCGKGSYWRISPEEKENLMRDLLRPPVTDLQPPVALLPHDGNRKLRPIMPKPTFDATKLQYVPLVNYNLPIVFVPSMPEAGARPCQNPTQSVATQGLRNYYVNPAQKDMVCSNAQAATQPVVVENSDSLSTSRAVTSVSECHQNESALSDIPLGTPPNRDQCTHARRKTTRRGPKESSASKRQRSEVQTKSKRVPNILRRNKQLPMLSPECAKDTRLQTPLKNSVQSTLAAINASSNTPMKRVDDFLNMAPAPPSSPLGHNRSFDIFPQCFGSPGISPLRSPLCFRSGLTPLGHGNDSIVMTPNNAGLGDLSFNWTPFKMGSTPIATNNVHSNNSNFTQRCRKSLGLEQINETAEYNESTSCW